MAYIVMAYMALYSSRSAGRAHARRRRQSLPNVARRGAGPSHTRPRHRKNKTKKKVKVVPAPVSVPHTKLYARALDRIVAGSSTKFEIELFDE